MFPNVLDLGTLFHEASYGHYMPGSGFQERLVQLMPKLGGGNGMLFSLKHGLGGRDCVQPLI